MWPSDGSLVVGPRSGHEPGFIFGRELLGNLPRQLCGFYVDLAHAVAQVEFTEHDGRSAKRVGFDDIASYAEEVRVDVTNDVGTAQHQHFAAVFLAPEIIQGGITLLNVGPHRSVVNDDAFFYDL